MNLENLTIKEARKLLDEKKVSSLELTSFYLKRIAEFDPQLKTCISVFSQDALAEARLADSRLAKGEKGDLLGIPYLLKDNILAKNKKTTASSKMLANYIAPYDATVVKKLKEAGAILLGKTNLDEFAHGASTENSAFFTTKNPWNQERVPGGSSGGSAAAVAADFCVFALGSDTGGSIRQPASFCNVLGLKPTYGSVSRFGLISMTSSTDVIGPLTKSADDAKIVLKYLAGIDEFDLTSSDKKRFEMINKKKKKEVLKINAKSLVGLKIGVVKEFLEEGVSEDIKNGVLEAIKLFKSLGAEIKNISLPYNKYSIPVYYIITPSELSSNLARFDGIRYGHGFDFKPKGGSEETLGEIYLKNRGDGFGPEAKRRIMLGTYALSSGYFDAYYKKAMAVKEKICLEFSKTFSKVDIIITPTSPHTAFKIGEQSNDPIKMYLEDIFLTGSSLAGLPALSLPAGFSNGLPFGLQIMADKFQDELILDLAKVFQTKTNYHKNFPKINF